jgi:hypothetical protein
MTTYWLEGQSVMENPLLSPQGVSLSDFNSFNMRPESANWSRHSTMYSDCDEGPEEKEQEDEEPSLKYVSFLNMPSLPNAADIISNDSGLLELFDDEEQEEFPG